jgi:signal recognition particle subunit SRP54
MFENLTDKLERSFKILKGEGRITEINIAETLKEIRRALIDADVNYKVAKSFTDEVKQKALGQDVLKAVKPGQMMTKIVRDELALLMGGTATDIRLEGNPAVILIAGLQGSGKTTFSGKLASFIKSKKGRQVLLVAGDVYRPAAIDQLKVLGGQIGVEVYTEEGSKDPVQIAENAIKYARQHAFNVVIVDTAGRLAVDEAMMQEITAIKTAVKPSETLFVVDAMTGQDAVNTAREFNDRLDFDGVVLTPTAQKQAAELTELGFGSLPICMAKTQYSFSDNAALLGAPRGFTITVRNIKVSAGAGFLVALTGDIMTMPGLPKVPAAEKVDVDENGRISGLF